VTGITDVLSLKAIYFDMVDSEAPTCEYALRASGSEPGFVYMAYCITNPVMIQTNPMLQFLPVIILAMVEHSKITAS